MDKFIRIITGTITTMIPAKDILCLNKTGDATTEVLYKGTQSKFLILHDPESGNSNNFEIFFQDLIQKVNSKTWTKSFLDVKGTDFPFEATNVLFAALPV